MARYIDVAYDEAIKAIEELKKRAERIWRNEADDPGAIIPEGVTLRDYFAAKAMQGLLNTYTGGAPRHGIGFEKNNEALAGVSYIIADAMLKEREE